MYLRKYNPNIYFFPVFTEGPSEIPDKNPTWMLNFPCIDLHLSNSNIVSNRGTENVGV